MVFVFLWELLIPVALLLLSLVVAFVYRFQQASHATHGSALVTPRRCTVGTRLARVRVNDLSGLRTIYGSLGAAISLLLYLSVSAGAELRVQRSTRRCSVIT